MIATAILATYGRQAWSLARMANATHLQLDDSLRDQIILVMVIAYATLFVIGTLGNLAVISMLVHIFVSMKSIRTQAPLGSTKNVFVYVLGLSVVDLLVLLHLPFLITNMLLRRWIFSTFMCKLYWFGESVNKILSSMLLCVLAWDRYMAVCHPMMAFKFRRAKVAMSVLLCCTLVASAMLGVPIFKFARLHQMPNDDWWPSAPPNIRQNLTLCSLWVGSWFMYYTFVGGFFVPGLLIVFFYVSVLCSLRASSKNVGRWNVALRNAHHPRLRQVTTRILAVVVFYFVCWTPQWTLTVLSKMGVITAVTGDYFMVSVFYAAHLLICFNSAANPVFYALLNSELRQQHAAAMLRRRQSWNAVSNNFRSAVSFFGDYGHRLTARYRETVTGSLPPLNPTTRRRQTLADCDLADLRSRTAHLRADSAANKSSGSYRSTANGVAANNRLVGNLPASRSFEVQWV